jgi:hypothetical protein
MSARILELQVKTLNGIYLEDSVMVDIGVMMFQAEAINRD